MDCLYNYIGIRANATNGGYGIVEAPESNLYINDLPGVTFNMGSAVVNSDQSAFLDMWDSVQRRALKVFTTTFTNAMSKKYRLKQITESYTLPDVIGTATHAPVVGELRGIYIDCFIGKSSFHHIPVGTVKVYTTAACSFDLKIYGVTGNDTLTELDSFPVTSTGAGWKTVIVNKKYTNNRRLFIAYDGSDITSPSITLNGIDLNPWIYNLQYFFNHVFISGGTYDSIGDRFTSGPMDTYGITMTAGLQCSYDVLICNYRENIALAWWYLLGAELMKERIYTDRINRYTTIDLNKAKELRSEFEGLYTNELMTFVDSLTLSKDWCIDCDAIIRQINFLP